MEHITMNKKEREQLIIFEKIKQKEITRKEAALRLDISERWVRKKYNRYIKNGAVGLVHQNRNTISPRRWCTQEKALSIDLLRSDWLGFGPTFAAEKLAELKGINISKETLRKAMIAGGVWRAKEKRYKHRKRRERKSNTGLMTQLDGSPHDWFEGRGPACTLLVFIDDAASELLWLEFVSSESALAVMTATKNYMLKHGRPHSIYVDHGSVFSVNLNNPEHEKKTQWERAMQELHVEVVHANSPQAKGRVERSNGTAQDRLVKEMRLAGICSIDEANQFLRDSGYIAKHNKLFAVPPAQKENAHRPIEAYNLNEIFCFKNERVLTNDYIITFEKLLFQLDKQQSTTIRPKDKITVKVHLDGTITLCIRNTKLAYTTICSKPLKQVQTTSKQSKQRRVHENSRRWASGLPFLESRVKTAIPAEEVKNRN